MGRHTEGGFALHLIPYSLNQMLWLLQTIFCSFHLRVATIREQHLLNSVNTDGMEDEKSTASRKVKWLQTPGSQDNATRPLQQISSSRNQTPFQMLEEDEDELEENKLVLEDC